MFPAPTREVLAPFFKGAASVLRDLGSCNAWLLGQWIPLEKFSRVGRLPLSIVGDSQGADWGMWRHLVEEVL